MIVPGGGITADGSRWVSCRPNFLLSVKVLSRLFRELFLAKLRAAHQAGRLKFCGGHAHLDDANAFKAYLAPLRKIEWVVYAKRPRPPTQARFRSRSGSVGGLIAGCAIAARAKKPSIQIVGVESALYPSMWNTLHQGNRPCGGATLAEGIAVKNVGKLTLPVVCEFVRDIILVDEPQIERAVNAFLTLQKTMAEGAGAAGLPPCLLRPIGSAAARSVSSSAAAISIRVFSPRSWCANWSATTVSFRSA